MYQLNINKELTVDYIRTYINDYCINEVPKMNKEKRYALGKHDISNRILKDENKPNNRISHPYAQYIVQTLSSYFMGNPVSYSSDDNMDELNKIFKYNDEAAENLQLARDASTFGRATEIVYVDELGQIRFKSIDPREVVLIYEDSIEQELLYAIRFYKTKDIVSHVENEYVEVYDRQSIRYYDDCGGQTLEYRGQRPHGFKGMVPINVYKNNEEEVNDFDTVISLIDAMDKIVSDNVNDHEAFTDAYLVLKGLGSVDSQQLASMRENRVLCLDEDSGAEWLTKDATLADSQAIEDRLNDDIYKFSSCIDLTDDISAVSGVAIKYRLLGMENAAAAKESQFKKALIRRIELISLILSAFNSDEIITKIDVIFTRNIPTDLTESINAVNQLSGIISDETLLGLLPFVDDPVAELKKKDSEIAVYGDVEHDHMDQGTDPEAGE